MTRPDPGRLRDLALATAREAGALVLRLRAEGGEIAGTKSSDIDIVTRADQAAEALVKERLLGARPDDGMVGEEGDDLAGSSGVVWIVDPIDGTVNYLYGHPHFAVSIAAEVDGEVVAGVVVAPALGLEYVATLGGGATCNGDPVRVRDVVPMAQRLHRLVNHHEGRYDEIVVHAPLLPRTRCFSNTILGESRMGGN